MLKNTPNRYASPTVLLHWLVFLLVAAAYTFVFIHVNTGKENPWHETSIHWHMMCGVTVLALVIIRLVFRVLAGSKPAINPAPAKWMLHSANLVHVFLYAFLFAMPLMGWFAVGASFPDMLPFGLPAIADASKDVSHQVIEIHELLGLIGLFVIGVHAVAALFHHYFMKDDTLKRMSFKAPEK